MRSLALGVIAAGLLSACQGLDDDRAFAPRHEGTFLLAQVGSSTRLDAYFEAGFRPDWGREALGLPRVRALSAHRLRLSVVDDSLQRLVVYDVGAGLRRQATIQGLGPLRGVLTGENHAVVFGTQPTAAFANLDPAFQLSETIALSFVPRYGVFSGGRFYLCDSARIAVIEEQSLALRTTVTVTQPLDTLLDVQVDNVGQILLLGRRGGAFATITFDNQALVSRGTANLGAVRQLLLTPFFRTDFGRERTANVTVGPGLSVTPQPTDVLLVPGTTVSSGAFDFRASVAYYVLNEASLVRDPVLTSGDGATVHTSTAPYRIERSAHLWRLP